MHSFKQFSKQTTPQDSETLLSIKDPHHKTEQQYEEFKKIYLTSFLLHTEKCRLKAQIETLMQTVSEADAQISKIAPVEQNKDSPYSEQTQKRCRRKADDIERNWECRQERCDKRYGSQATLLQHVKFKHPHAYQKYYP